jgi:hypothetical protein
MRLGNHKANLKKITPSFSNPQSLRDTEEQKLTNQYNPTPKLEY